MRVKLWPLLETQLPLENVAALTAELFQEKGWTVVTKTDNQRTTLQARRNGTGFRPFAPRHATVSMSFDGTKTALQMRFALDTKSAAAYVTLMLIACVNLVRMIAEFSVSTAIGSIVGASAIALGWLYEPTSLELRKSLGHRIYQSTGYPLEQIHPAITESPSPGILLPILLLFAMVSLWVASHDSLVRSLDAWYLLLSAVGIFVAYLHYPIRREHGPFLVGASTLCIYCVWPSFALRTSGSDTPSWGPLWIVYSMTAFCAWLIWTATNTNISGEEHASATSPAVWSRYLIGSAFLLFWASAVWGQLHAIPAVFALLGQATARQQPRFAAQVGLWIFPILFAYLLVIVGAFRRTIQLWRATAKTTPALEQRSRHLAAAMRTSQPKLAIVSEPSHAVHHLLLGRIICLSEQELPLLSDGERDALLLHELSHLNRHAKAISTLALLSGLTLCGLGITGALLDTRRMELEADEDAVQTLNSLGQPGRELVRKMLGKLIAAGISRGPSSDQQGPARIITKFVPLSIVATLKVFVEGGSPWYEHPQLAERFKALEDRAH